MKLIKIIIPAIVILLGSCKSIHEDLSGCPVNGNVVLHFRYMENGIDKFSDHISGVHVAVFDNNEALVVDKTVSTKELTVLQGTRLTLPEGNYRVICWANTGVNNIIDHLSQNTRLTDFTVSVLKDENGKASTADNMFYAPRVSDINNTELEKFIISIPAANTSVEKTIEFMPAHNTIEVYFKGVTGIPIVEITELAQSYDFLKQSSSAKMSFIQSARATVLADSRMEAKFFTPHFDNDNDILIHITAGSTQLTIDLREFMIENNIQVSHIDHTFIQIMVEFAKGQLNVSVPDWTNTDVEPDFE